MTGKRNIVLVSTLGCLLVARSQAAQIFARSEDLPPLAITYSDVGELIDSIHATINIVNPPTNNVYAIRIEDIEIEADGRKFSLDDRVSMEMLAKAPTVGYRLIYNFRQREAPITTVALYFTDYS